MLELPTYGDVCDAAERIKPYVKRTPVLTCTAIDKMVGAALFFKCENFQKVGAFKFRGAGNAVLSLSDSESARGVATHSSGNHGAALALAAKNRGIKAYVIMPETSLRVKKEAVAGYGAEIIFCKPTLEARETTLAGVIKDNGAAFIHPYNNYNVIAGQGTATLELVEEVENLDMVLAPVGGGGLLSGTALAVCGFSPETKVIGCEPKGADDAYRSIKERRIIPSINPRTIADGLLTSLGERTFAIISRHVHRIVTVNDDIIIKAMRLIWERMKIIVEPSAAVPLAVVLDGNMDIENKRIGIIISGGNVDLDLLPWLQTADK